MTQQSQRELLEIGHRPLPGAAMRRGLALRTARHSMLNAIGLRRRRRSEVVYEDAVQLADGRMTVDDHEEIRQLIALHAQFLDERRWTDLAGLFCSDGVLPWAGQTFRGRHAIIDGLPATQPATPHGIKHFVFAPVIEIHDDEARAWSDVIVSLVPQDGPAEMSFVGRYHDHLRREEGRWLLSEHITVRTGEALPDGERLPTALGGGAPGVDG